MVWMTFQRASRCYGVVHQRVLRTGVDAVLGRPGFGRECAYANVNVALAGSRALWSWHSWTCDCRTSFGKVVIGAPGKRQRVVQQLVGHGFATFGDWVSGMAGDGPTLAYGMVNTEYVDSELGIMRIARSRVGRVAGAVGRLVPNAGHPSALSVSGPRIAVVNAGDAGGIVGPVENGPVHIRSAVTGDPIATITPTGFPRAVALGGRQAVLLVDKSDGTRHLEIYDAETGALVTSAALSTTVALRIDADHGRVVYHRGRVIRLFSGGQSRVLAVAARMPIGLSIEGRRVTWAENLNGRGRVRSVMVGGSS